jgi:soluble lytic murein transglycosylase-like protein
MTNRSDTLRERWRRWWRLPVALAMFAATFAFAAAPPPPQIDPGVVEALAKTMAQEVNQSDRFDAQVWLLSSMPKLGRYVSVETERTSILKSVYREANRQKMDPDLVLAVMQVESKFDRFAVSSAGAQGLMQVMPFWRTEIGRPQDNLTHIETNVRYGTAILAHYLTETRGDLIDALARYNGSRGRLNYPELVVYAYRARWQTQTTDDLPKLRAGCLTYGLNACKGITSGR